MASNYALFAFALRRILNVSNIEIIKRVRSGISAENIFEEFSSSVNQQKIFKAKNDVKQSELIKRSSAIIFQYEKLGYFALSIWDNDYPEKLCRFAKRKSCQ